MAQNEIKTRVTQADVPAFIEAIADEKQRADASKICEMMSSLSGEPPKMWGPSIIGFGQYRYKYDSGREGDAARIAFSPRKGNTVLYIADGFAGHADLLTQLGKHKTGKSCLYIRRLTDIDEAELKKLCAKSLQFMAKTYPDGA